jgi:hypothetical protein
MGDAISGSKTKPSAVPPLFPIPLTLMLLTAMAEPGTMLTSDFSVDIGWVGGDGGKIHLEKGTGVSMGEGEEAEASIRAVLKDTKR